MMLYHDCCKIVGIEPDADLNQIKIAYRRKAKYIHPDINISPSAHRDFIILTRSFEYIKQVKQQELLLNQAFYGKSSLNNNDNWYDFYKTQQLKKTRHYYTAKYKKHIHFKSTLIGRIIFISAHVVFLLISLLITFNPLVSAIKHGIDPNVSMLSAITSATFSFTFGIIMSISIVLSGINIKSGF